MPSPRTLYQKHIDSHTVCTLDDQGHMLLYIDRQVANEYTSPQAFSGLRDAGRTVWRPAATLAVVDHVNPTAPKRIATMHDAGGARQVSYFEENCRDFGIELFDVLDKRQGIEHVVAPEQGFILPGMVVAAGGSFDDVVDVTVFMVDPQSTFETIWEVVPEFWGEAPHPTITAVGVTWLYGFQFEIKVIARLPEETRA